MKIGVFDSGIGGKRMAQAIKRAFPHCEISLKSDTEHVPYGDRHVDEILGFTLPLVQELIDEGCDVIVIACNTVSTNLIAQLRQTFTVPFVAMEPMVKPAALLTKSGVIAVCATPLTLSSPRYSWLKAEYVHSIKVLEPDCSDWAYLIEHNKIDRKKIAGRLNEVLEAGADVIVLGCTHYHWIEQEINDLVAGRAMVLQPEQPVIEQLKRVLARLP